MPLYSWYRLDRPVSYRQLLSSGLPSGGTGIRQVLVLFLLLFLFLVFSSLCSSLLAFLPFPWRFFQMTVPPWPRPTHMVVSPYLTSGSFCKRVHEMASKPDPGRGEGMSEGNRAAVNVQPRIVREL